jgi:hypothetical protein
MNPLLQSVVASLKAGTQTEAIAQIDRVTDYCMSRNDKKVFDGWDREPIRLLVAYHWAKGTLLVHEKDGEVDGIFMWYRCNLSDDWSFITEWMPDRPDGDSIFMAFLHAENPKAFKEIVLNFLRFEPAVFTLNLFGSRVRKNQETRIMYSPKLFLKILAIKESNKNGE